MSFDDLQSRMVNKMRQQVDDLSKRVREQQHNEVAQTARALKRYTLADLPTADSTLTGYMVWVTDGQNPDENTGAGTGCLMICDGTDWVWPSAQLASSANTAGTADYAGQATNALSVPTYANLAAAPTPTIAYRGYMGFFPTARKAGEAADDGTGVLAIVMYETTALDYRWVRSTDYTEIVF